MNQKSLGATLAQRQLDAYNRKDINAFCAVYHPEVSALNLKTGNRLQGMEVFRRRYEQLFKDSPNLRCELVQRREINGMVTDEERVTGLAGRDEPLHCLAIYGLRDGLIDRVWFV